MITVIIDEVPYLIDEDGNILKRRGKGFLRVFPDKDGYLKVAIKRGKGRKTHNEFLHRIVYRAFNGDIPDGMTVDHIDNNRTNNHKDNLQLLTAEENAVKGNSKTWIVVSPSGEELVVYNIEKFCRDNGLHPSHIKTCGYKGWKCSAN